MTSLELRRRLGHVGAWSFAFVTGEPASMAAAAAAVEGAGCGVLWYPETPRTGEAMTQAGLLLAATSSASVCSGVAAIWARDATATARAASLLGHAHQGRFVLGLGVSHERTTAQRGHTYRNPLDTMASYLDEIDEVLGVERPPRVLGALAPQMLALARDRADGVLTYFVPTEHTADARTRLGSEPVLAVALACVLDTDAAAARAAARRYARVYFDLPNYRRTLCRLGYSESQLDDGGDDVIDAVVAWGDAGSIAERVREHLAAGADHVALQPLSADPVADWGAIATAL